MPWYHASSHQIEANPLEIKCLDIRSTKMIIGLTTRTTQKHPQEEEKSEETQKQGYNRRRRWYRTFEDWNRPEQSAVRKRITPGKKIIAATAWTD